VIEGRLGGDNLPHHAVVPQVGGGDQGSAVDRLVVSPALAPSDSSSRSVFSSSATEAIGTAS